MVVLIRNAAPAPAAKDPPKKSKKKESEALPPELGGDAP